MRLLVTGAGGLLGRELLREGAARGHDVVGLGRAELDVTDPKAVGAALTRAAPDAVAHCAAYTAVDRAESEPDEALRVNRDGAAHVALAARRAGARMVHLSTDFVFDGASERPYRPDDPPAPLGVYGHSKLEGERAVLAEAPDALVARTSWVYGAGGRSFVTAILARAETGEPLRVVSDQVGRPAWTGTLAEALLDLVEGGARGTFHVADGGETTWYGLAREALRLRGLDAPIEPVSAEEWGAPAPRPLYSVLDTSATEAFLGRAMAPWPEALRRFLVG